MMRALAVLAILLGAAVARADELPVMTHEQARGSGATEYRTPDGEVVGVAPVKREGEIRSDGMTDTERALISGRDGAARADTPVQKGGGGGPRGPRRENRTTPAAVPNAVPNSIPNAVPNARPGPGPDNRATAAPDEPQGSAPTDGRGADAGTPPPSAVGPRVSGASTNRVAGSLSKMKGALGSLQDAGGQAGAAQSAAAPGTAPAATALPHDATLRDLGLRAGTGPDGRPAVLDASGRPASDAALAALAARVATEPRALAKRPDFYNVIPSRRYDSLKRDFAASGGARPEYRDMGLRDRDFAWTRSCDRVSGTCNPLAAEKSYKQNDEVSPETLANVWKRLNEERGGGEDGWADYVKEQRKTYEESLEREARAEGIRARLSRSIFGAGSRLAKILKGFTGDGGSSSEAGSAMETAASARDAEPAGAAGASRARTSRRYARSDEEHDLLPGDAPSLPWGRIAFALLGAAVFAWGLRLYRRNEMRKVELAPLPPTRDEKR